jgi:hypothetical protein
LEIQHNAAVSDLAALAFGLSTDTILAWTSTAANSGQTLGRGSTDTGVASGAFRFIIGGQAATEAKAAVTTATALTAQTVPADTWALYVFDVPTGGTIAMLPAAANATTGYATEALAIAACPPRITAKARLGYITVKTKAATVWIGATDALAGGATGNPASVTNYYPFDGIFAATGAPTNCSNANGQWSIGGRNGVLIPTTLARGSTDTNVATIALTFNANGAVNIAKAAVAAGTAIPALTVPADKWGLWCMFIPSTGTPTFLAAPGNSTGDYGNEAAAINALSQMTPTAGSALLGYVTVKTKAATAFVAGTDGLAGGSSGNVASATNYYPTAGAAPATGGIGLVGMTAAQIATKQGTVISAAQY